MENNADKQVKQVEKEVLDKVNEANKYFDENPPKAHSQEELDKVFKRGNLVG